MYTKILAQGTKFGSGTTGLDHPGLYCVVCVAYCIVYYYTKAYYLRGNIQGVRYQFLEKINEFFKFTIDF